MENKADAYLEELIRQQNKKPVKSLEEFYKNWTTDEDADQLFDFIMQERKERRKGLGYGKIEPELEEEIEQSSADKWDHFLRKCLIPNLPKIFCERGIEIQGTSERLYSPEVTVSSMAFGKNCLIAIEVINKLELYNVDYLVDDMPKLKKVLYSYKDKELFGALAYLESSEEVEKYAMEKGFFLLAKWKESACIKNDQSFMPKAW